MEYKTPDLSRKNKRPTQKLNYQSNKQKAFFYLKQISFALALNPCEPNPCHNNGACVPNGINTYTCNCVNGFTGETCGVARKYN